MYLYMNLTGLALYAVLIVLTVVGELAWWWLVAFVLWDQAAAFPFFVSVKVPWVKPRKSKEQLDLEKLLSVRAAMTQRSERDQ